MMASNTLSLLEDRIRPLTYLIHGTTTLPSLPPSSSASARLRNLERALHVLTSHSPAAADILALQKSHPNIFHPATTTTTAPSLSPASLAALVLAHTQLYTSTSSHLSHLASTPLPDPASIIQLVNLQPRIARAIAKQEQQAREIAELRARSARVVEQWYESGVLGMGEQWAGWEERIREGEILVRRREARLRREEGGLG